MLDRLKRLFSGGRTQTRTGDEGFGWDDDLPVDASADNYRVELDRTRQVLRLECEEAFDFGGGLAAAPVEPSFRGPPFVSTSILAQKAKQFDDGLYAAVELAAQAGAGSFRGKKWLLKTLLDRLGDLPHGSDTGVLFGAAGLGNVGAPTPLRLQPQAHLTVRAFLANGLRSKPISFYTWSDDLRRIFQQDRLLQSELFDEGIVSRIARTLEEAEGAAAVYDQYLELTSRLSNPLGAPGLRSGEKKGVSFFPPSRSHETDLGKKLYGDRPIPDDFNLAEELIRAVRGGAVSLAPRADSGWYDLQTWALESLIVPDVGSESARLRMGKNYRDRLEDLFKGALALARETHVKQLEFATLAAGPGRFPTDERPTVVVRPQLTVEPLYTHYLRRAIGYRHLHAVLEETFGVEGLRSFERMTPDGATDVGLDQELLEVAGLFFGASVAASRELGFSVEERIEMEGAALARAGADAGATDLGSGEGADTDAARFERWAENVAEDRDLKRDARMMVPLFYDLGREKTKVWVFLGWSQQPFTASFESQPDYKIFDSMGRRAEGTIEVEVAPLTRMLSYPMTAEVYVRKLLNRAEFQAHCDRYRSAEEILDALG